MSPAAHGNFGSLDYKTRLPALDSIRALAIVMVFLEHFGGGSHGGRILRDINFLRERGWVGVDLFFVLSGFLITGILYDTRSDSRYFQRFFARRSLRIFPVFYLVVVLLLLLTPILGLQWKWQQLSFLVYLGNFFAVHDFSQYDIPARLHPFFRITIGHFWSLCVEEQFYLLWPLAIWIIRDRRRLIQISMGLSLVAFAARCYMVLTHSQFECETYIVRLLPFRMDTLLIGGVLALLLRGPASDVVLRSCRGVFIICSIAAAAILLSNQPWGSPWVLTFGYTMIALASAGLIGVTLRPGSLVYRLFLWKPLRTIGKYSYGFYIFHYLFAAAWIQLLVRIASWTHSMVISGIVALTLNFCVTFLVAKFSYDFFEVFFIHLKKAFLYDSEHTSNSMPLLQNPL